MKRLKYCTVKVIVTSIRVGVIWRTQASGTNLISLLQIASGVSNSPRNMEENLSHPNEPETSKWWMTWCIFKPLKLIEAYLIWADLTVVFQVADHRLRKQWSQNASLWNFPTLVLKYIGDYSVNKRGRGRPQEYSCILESVLTRGPDIPVQIGTIVSCVFQWGIWKNTNIFMLKFWRKKMAVTSTMSCVEIKLAKLTFQWEGGSTQYTSWWNRKHQWGTIWVSPDWPKIYE